MNLAQRIERAAAAAEYETFRRESIAALPERMRPAAEAASRSVPPGDVRALTSAVLRSLPPDFRRELLCELAAHLGIGAPLQ